MKDKTILVLLATILSASLLVFSSCETDSNGDDDSQAPSGSNTELQTAEGVDGYLVYISKCSTCHGVNRQGGLGPSLDNDINKTFLIEWLPVHRTGVGLDPRLEGTLINWLYDNSTPSNNSLLTDSYQVFIQSCAMCHGADREGGNGGLSITLEDLSNFDAEFLKTFLIGHFSGVTLTNYQRDNLVFWLTVPHQPPLDLDTAEGVLGYYCGSCHPGDGPALHEGSMGGSVASVVGFVNNHLPGIPAGQLKMLAEWLAIDPVPVQ